jgi:hypothetical protein
VPVKYKKNKIILILHFITLHLELNGLFPPISIVFFDQLYKFDEEKINFYLNSLNDNKHLIIQKFDRLLFKVTVWLENLKNLKINEK